MMDRARDLRERLVGAKDDLAELCEEALSVFEAAGEGTHVRWLERELRGYPADTVAESLHETLGLPAEARLVHQVKMVRAQWGRIVEGPHRGTSLRYFFVEPVQELLAAHHRIQPAAHPGQKLRLDFEVQPARPWLPTSAKFPADVFNCILLGLRAMLHRELGQINVASLRAGMRSSGRSSS